MYDITKSEIKKLAKSLSSIESVKKRMLESLEADRASLLKDLLPETIIMEQAKCPMVDSLKAVEQSFETDSLAYNSIKAILSDREIALAEAEAKRIEAEKARRERLENCISKVDSLKAHNSDVYSVSKWLINIVKLQESLSGFTTSQERKTRTFVEKTSTSLDPIRAALSAARNEAEELLDSAIDYAETN